MARFILTFMIIAIVNFLQLSAQDCQGNLGENIFLEGDFGSGSANILLPDPQIAPGYIYQTQPPPNDGFYTITNDISVWSITFGWLEIQDNSPDPDGYMMVVNATFEPGLFYEQEVEGLCENTLYEFSADVFNLLPPGSNGILPNISFLIDGMLEFNTGEVPENAEWNTYGFTFTTAPGQTSVTLALQNNAPGGGGNDIALDNISFRPCGPEALILPEDIAIICEDGSFIDLDATIVGSQYDDPALQWQQSFDGGLTWEDIPGENGLVYTHTNLSGGFYYYRYLLANGVGNLSNSKCRVVSNVKILQIIPKFYSLTDTICEGLTYTFGNDVLNETGIYTDSLVSYFGCDSIVTLDLTMLPDPGIDAIFTTFDPACTDTGNGAIQIDAILNGVGPYAVTVNGDSLIGTDSIGGLFNGSYEIIISDKYGCSFSEILDLQEPDPLVLEIGPDLVVDLGEPVSISAVVNQEVDTILWSPSDIMPCEPDCFSFEWFPSGNSLVTATIFSGEGCTTSDSLLVEVTPIRKVYIPTIFSPNFDGLNDYFTIYGDSPNVLQVNKLLIFDRWGTLVFEQSNFTPGDDSSGWDGTYNGVSAPDGVYTYLADVLFFDNQSYVYSGSITLMK